MDLKLFTIIPLDTDHIDEICLDIENQYKSGAANCVLFMMTLVPEGNPPLDKVGSLCRRYMQFKEKLDQKGLCSGVLVQASIGHGWVLSEMFPFQQYTALETGEKKQIVCPLDADFREHMKNVFARIAKCKPAMIMLDDDFRLLSYRAGGGCCCPLHVAEFNRLAGTDFTREQIWKALHTPGAEGDRYNDIFVQVNKNALLGCADFMRAGIDSVDPTIPGSFCCVGNNAENGAEIAEILAGKGNPVVLRINNGAYAAGGTRFLSNVFLRTAQQISKVKDKVDVLLDESDTCPQNRYSTSAAELHTHFTGGILEGVRGAKHWITRLHALEPQSGIAYRETLSKYAGFYRTLADIVPELKWRGFRIPTTAKPCFDFRRNTLGDNAWATHVLEKFGLPMYFAPEFGGISCFEGAEIERFSDDEIKKLLAGKVFLAADSAKILCDRGFSALLGVEMREWKGEVPSYEKIYATNNPCELQNHCLEIKPVAEGVKCHSYMCHDIEGMNVSDLYPGVTEYKNSLGGTAVVFCGTPNAPFNIVTSFGYLNYSRKEQFIEIAGKLGELPVYYTGDAQVYFKAADYKDGLFCAAFNLGFDRLASLTLRADRKITEIKKLSDDGTLIPVDFTEYNGVITVNTETLTLIPTVLVMR